jgi:hypothetical protein
MENAVAVMRVSSEKQGFDGDSIEHQKDQIDLYASTRNITIKKYFVFIESASKEQQPIQEAIDYCANPKNNIQLFIIKSIDRFTRGGAFFYEHMKSELTRHQVRLVDLYGVINHQEVNTLEHLGVKYSWSVYTPSKKSELLEAERGKDELRDIMSRMIGSEIRYTRLGYRVRAAPFGYKNERIETAHGKRFILVPHPKESVWIKRIFELKAQALYSDKEIVRQINIMGFRTRRQYFRDPKNTTRAIGIKGEKELTLKDFDRLLRNPIYTGITVELWTQNKPVKCQFKGLVSLELFNKANDGKVMIFEENGELKILKDKVLKKRMVETKISMLYPYRKIVVCKYGRHPFYGSASRGRGKGYFPAYHCDTNKRGHYIRIPIKKFHETVIEYLRNVRIKRKYIEKFYADISYGQDIKLYDSHLQKTAIKDRLQQINREISLLILKIKMMHSETALEALESDIEKLKAEKDNLVNRKAEISARTNKDIMVNNKTSRVKRNRIPEVIVTDHNEVMKKQLFGLLFIESPSYDDLVYRTAILKPEFELAKQAKHG